MKIGSVNNDEITKLNEEIYRLNLKIVKLNKDCEKDKKELQDKLEKICKEFIKFYSKYEDFKHNPVATEDFKLSLSELIALIESICGKPILSKPEPSKPKTTVKNSYPPKSRSTIFSNERDASNSVFGGKVGPGSEQYGNNRTYDGVKQRKKSSKKKNSRRKSRKPKKKL